MDLLTPTLPFIENLQKMTGLLGLMQFFSYLGTEQFYLLLLPVIYWGVNRPLGARLGALLLFSVIVNEIFKVRGGQPRPYWFDEGLKLGNEASFGFPSGHAQNAFLIWPFLALQTNRRGLWMTLAILLALSISFSRVYLGVHFPTDCLGGAVIGLTILGLYRLAGPAWMRFWHQLSPFQKVTFAVFSAAFLSMAYGVALAIGTHELASDWNQPSLPAIQNANSWDAISKRLGAYIGLLTGIALAARYLHLPARPNGKSPLLLFVVGFFGLAFFYVGLGKVLPDRVILDAIRYGLVSFWVIFGAPWVLGKIEREKALVSAG